MHRIPTWVSLLLLAAVPALSARAEPAGWTLRPHETSTPAAPAKLAAVPLVLDDGSHEADVGFTGAAAFQFLWFNRFDRPSPGEPFDLEEIQVLFPSDPEIAPGAAIQLVVFSDPDGDPTNGADLVTAFDDVVQAADGTTFSVYPLTPAVTLPAGSGDVLVGVVNRFVTSGVSPPSQPAALDTSSSAGRSWVALWTGDPPDPPALPSDDVLDTIDAVSTPGNWMIRASGSPVASPAPSADIPALDGAGLAILAALLALVASALLRRRP